MSCNRLLAGSALVLTAGLSWSCGGGNPSPVTPTPSAPAVIAIVAKNGAMSFNPSPAPVKIGQTLSWHNADGLTHHVVEDAASGGDTGSISSNGGPSTGGFDAGTTAPGANSVSFKAGAAGVVHYHCSIHPSMVGSITVTQ